MTIKEYLTEHFHEMERIPLIRKCAKVLKRSERSCADYYTEVRREMEGRAPKKMVYKADRKVSQSVISKKVRDSLDKEYRAKYKDMERQLFVERKKVAQLSAANQKKVKLLSRDCDTYSFGLIGDTHFGSLYHDSEALKSYCDYAVKKKIMLRDFFL